MTTASNSESPLIDNTWLNQDCSQRLITIEKLDPEDSTSAAFFEKVAIDDEHEEVRCSAIGRINELGVLEKLQNEGGRVSESARQQIYRIIAGTLASKHSEAERIERLKQLPVAAIKQVALITKLKSIAACSVEAVTQNEDLADLCLFASNVHVRKTAASKIEDTALLKDILARVEGKDKTVSKLINARLESGSKAKPAATPATKEDVSTEQKPETRSKAEPVKAAKIALEEPPAIEPEVEVSQVEAEAPKLSFKNTARLFEIRSQLRKLRARLSDTEAELSTRIEELLAAIEVKISKNNEYQERLRERTEQLLLTLAEALEAGNSESATQCWDKIQGNISNTANQVRAELQKKANEHKQKITELRDWKIFAATEKKKELITQMEHLVESKMHAPDRSKSISKMHKEWKDLGRSNQNEQLWKQFKALSDQAYEPCKEYFKQRKQRMAENLQKRREICDFLEAEHKQLLEAEGEPDLAKLNKLLNVAEKDWKLYAPIEQSKIKSLQKRFYGTVNQLRKIRKSELSSHAKQKQELINQAQALTQHEDARHAMNEAKRLQQEWKKVGPTSYKEDNKFWHDFRAACDSIFGKRKQAGSEKSEELQKIEARLREILDGLAAIAKKSDAELRESRAAYQDLAQEFSHSLDPRIKAQRKRLLDQFNATKRQIDSRFRALPDKRQQQIQENLSAKSTMLLELEGALLQEESADKFAAYQQAFDSGAWSAVAASGNDELDASLQQRLDTALAAKSRDELAKQCANSEAQFRELCVLAEIRANVDSPAEDKALRMKLQLAQLQSGFGQAKPDAKQNLKYAMETEFMSYAPGPLADSVRKALEERLGLVLQKLR